MAKAKEGAPYQDIEVEVDGQTHRAYYKVEGGRLTLFGVGGGSSSTQLGALSAEVLAREMLRDNVRRSKNQNNSTS